MVRSLVLQHEDSTPPGLLTEWLERRRAAVEAVRVDLEEPDLDPTHYDVLVSLGSESAAYHDSNPCVQREAGLLRRAVGRGVLVLGGCFGGQLLARVLGSVVFRAPGAEIG
ncbi:MAG TPA: hypothetical protein VNO34_08740 [Actinomycetota bacterium]|nr:hypothetical protein [Actinomycetota bacterium]